MGGSYEVSSLTRQCIFTLSVIIAIFSLSNSYHLTASTISLGSYKACGHSRQERSLPSRPTSILSVLRCLQQPPLPQQHQHVLPSPQTITATSQNTHVEQTTTTTPPLQQRFSFQSSSACSHSHTYTRPSILRNYAFAGHSSWASYGSSPALQFVQPAPDISK